MPAPKDRLHALLRSLERYAKTDMVYLASSGFWINLTVFFTSFLSLLLSIAFANLLPAETYGLYQYLLSFSTIIGAFTLTGMNYAVTQAVARGYEGVVRRSVTTQLRWSVLPLLIGICIGMYYLIQGNSELGIGLVLIGIFIPLISAFNTYAGFLNGRKEFRQAFIYSAFLATAYYGGIILAVVYLKDALLLLFVNLFINAIVLAILYVRTLRRYQPNDLTDPETLSYGKHLSVMYLPSLVVRQIDNILVFQFLGPVSLAVYAFASTVPERLAGFFRFIFIAALPKFATQSGTAIRSGMLPKMARVTMAGLVVALVYIALAPLIFEWLFPAYMEAVPYSQFYALIIAASASNLSVSALLSQKLKRELYLFYSLGPFVQLVLQVVLLLQYGIWGMVAARILASLIDTVASAGLFYIGSRRS